jgi:hypothetical protein
LDIERRRFLLSLMTVILAASSTQAFADGGNSGSGGGGNSGSGGGDNSGSGGDGSNDADDGDDDKDDDDEREDNSGRGKGSRDPDRARNAVKAGKAVPLQKLLSHLRDNYRGRVLKVDIEKRLGSYFYKVRLLGNGNRVQTLRLDAKTLQRKLF